MGRLFLIFTFWGALAYGAKTQCGDDYSLLVPMPLETELTTSRLRIIPQNRDPDVSLNLSQMAVLDRNDGTRLGWVVVSVDTGTAAKILTVSIRKDRRGEELGPEAEAAVIDQLFQHQQVQKIEAVIAPGNARSVAAHRKLGFKPSPESPDAFVVTFDDFKRATAGRQFGSRLQVHPAVPAGN